jgi:hypothetical protein
MFLPTTSDDIQFSGIAISNLLFMGLCDSQVAKEQAFNK